MNDHLRFSIEESVWFQKGEEIDDVLSISLEPDIVVGEYGDVVSVRGTLQLKGEFRPAEREEDDESHSESSLPNRFVQEVTRSAEGKAFFKHRFPVDITIPLSRVKQLDDIYVHVESFDYKLVNEQCLQLTADLEITGIQEEGALTTQPEKQEEREETTSVDLAEQPSFEIDVKQEVRDTEQDDEKQEIEASFAREEVPEHELAPQIEMKGREEESEEMDRAQDDNEHDTIVAFAKTIDQPVDAADAAGEPEMETAAEASEGESAGEEQAEKTHRNENALYLTKMLTRDEETFSKLKMRIIQPGDSLDSIAERYEVTPSHLVKMNKLEQEEIEEGQILYIPVRTGH